MLKHCPPAWRLRSRFRPRRRARSRASRPHPRGGSISPTGAPRITARSCCKTQAHCCDGSREGRPCRSTPSPCARAKQRLLAQSWARSDRLRSPQAMQLRGGVARRPPPYVCCACSKTRRSCSPCGHRRNCGCVRIRRSKQLHKMNRAGPSFCLHDSARARAAVAVVVRDQLVLVQEDLGEGHRLETREAPPVLFFANRLVRHLRIGLRTRAPVSQGRPARACMGRRRYRTFWEPSRRGRKLMPLRWYWK
jgi:hypothetical protein